MDQKPLEAIIYKPLRKCPLRLQHMRIRLQAYDVDIKNKPGKEMYIVNAVSRASNEAKYISLSEQEVEAQEICMHLVRANHPPPLPDSPQEIRDLTSGNTVLQKFGWYISQGWPDNIMKVELEISQYCPFREDLAWYDGIIYKGQQILIPLELRK
ncbi:hypothetical protein PR048_026980 [Dryococelus australis]|uniref:Uncharacterized protein n=1 Tax=Dryococelus australis TaxID=614101 RepID=A0ABQ9GMT6_9NEOP|nr:hypothetical protein PR048_026980 [Dryococelus australis]